MIDENLIADELHRMDAFRMLAACYFFPDALLPVKLKHLEHCIQRVCGPAEACIRRMRRALTADPDFGQLKVDFSKLFVGPYNLQAAPYGSVYLEDGRKMMGTTTLDARHRYREEGLDMSGEFKDAPDHIAAELEFMHYLVFKEIESLSRADTPLAIGFVHKQSAFLEHHLLAWVPEFTARTAQHAHTGFYRNLARATDRFLEYNHRRACSQLPSFFACIGRQDCLPEVFSNTERA